MANQEPQPRVWKLQFACVTPALCALQGLESADLWYGISLYQTSSQLSLSSQFFLLLFALLFPCSPRSHSRQHLPINEHFKRLRCRCYWFLCLGCGALGDFIKDEAPVVFLSKLPRSACQSEVRGARTRERIHTGRRNVYPWLRAKRHAKMKHKASFISKN